MGIYRRVFGKNGDVASPFVKRPRQGRIVKGKHRQGTHRPRDVSPQKKHTVLSRYTRGHIVLALENIVVQVKAHAVCVCAGRIEQ